MELKIKETNYTPIIIENFEEIKALVQDKADHYANMVYTEDDLPQAKKDKATLNKFIKAIEDRRKEVKKACMQPYESFETQVKELVTICNKPVQAISELVEIADNKAKDERLEELTEFFKSKDRPEWLEFSRILDPKWLNRSTKVSAAEEAIEEVLKRVNSDVKTLETLEYSFEAIDAYKRTLSLADAIREGQRIAELMKRKQGEAGKPETEKPAVEKPDYEAEQRQWIPFKVYISPSEARELKAWLVQKGIEIRA